MTGREHSSLTANEDLWIQGTSGVSPVGIEFPCQETGETPVLLEPVECPDSQILTLGDIECSFFGSTPNFGDRAVIVLSGTLE
jgi:hypothetical protein